MTSPRPPSWFRDESPEDAPVPRRPPHPDLMAAVVAPAPEDPAFGRPGGLRSTVLSGRRLVLAVVGVAYAAMGAYDAGPGFGRLRRLVPGVEAWVPWGLLAAFVVFASLALARAWVPHVLMAGETADFHELNCRCAQRHSLRPADGLGALVGLLPLALYAFT